MNDIEQKAERQGTAHVRRHENIIISSLTDFPYKDKDIKVTDLD